MNRSMPLICCIFRDNLSSQHPQQADIATGDADVVIAYCNIEKDGFAGKGGNISADFNRDGQIDLGDFATFALDWQADTVWR